MNRLKILLAALLIGSGVAGCAHHAGNEPGSVQPEAAAASVDVSNGYALAMDVFAISNGTTTRLGAVSPGTHGTFVIEPSLLRTGFIQIVAQPLGGGVVADTGSLPLRPGEVLQFDIAAIPRFSTTAIR
jgi:hypothetical protein